MKGFGWILLLLIVSLVYVDAFVPPTVRSPSTTHPKHQPATNLQLVKHHHSAATTLSTIRRRTVSSQGKQLQSSSGDINNAPNNANPTSSSLSPSSLTHADILWKLKPSRDAPLWRRIWLKIAANLIRLDCFIKRQEPPLVLCPKGGQAVLEAHILRDVDGGKLPFFFFRRRRRRQCQQIGRFGFTTMAGPSNVPIQETVHDLYNLDANRPYRAGAIIYMFVEEEFRKRNVGTLALQVISLIQNIQACDFTMLVVDDNGSGKLNDWYERRGYQRAPKLQTMLGSPNAIHGVSMMTPTNRELPNDCQIQWW